jgi:hypothetical protein
MTRTLATDHTLEFLLAFNGRVHWRQQGYRLKFEIVRIHPTPLRAHGLRYSFTLHDPDGKRLIGFDNAHAAAPRSRFKKKRVAADHWHRTDADQGRPYELVDADTLLQDFFREVRRVLSERGISETVIRVSEKGQDDDQV